MIRAVFFDFYNTLGRFEPSREELQLMICKQFDIFLDVDGIRKGYGLADSYMAREVSIKPLRKMNTVESQRFFGEYQKLILEGAGFEVDIKLAYAIMEKLLDTPKRFALFDDVLPVLNKLKGDNFLLGLLTNNEGDINKLCRELGLSNLMDVAINSEQVGHGKPYPDIFVEAMRRVNVKPYQTIYIGDQYDTDIKGAKNAGIVPVLLDRDCVNQDFLHCTRIEKMYEIFDVLNELS